MAEPTDHSAINSENNKDIDPVPESASENKDDPAESVPLEPKFFNIVVKSPKGTETTLQISLADNVQDIKQFLFESKDLCHITSYALLFNGTPINNFAELKDIEGLEEGSVLIMEERPYTQFDSRLHVNKLRELLAERTERPFSLLSSLTTQLEEEMANELKNQKPSPPSGTKNSNSNNSKKGKKGKKNRKKKQHQPTSNNNSTSQPQPPKSQLPQFSTEQCHFGNFFPSEKKKTECIRSISYSGWNPPPGNRQCKGDLAYLVVHTLENKTFHITSSCKGFYVNNSTSSKFDPLPAPQSHFSHSLVDVLNQISPIFKEKFQILLENFFISHPFEVIPIYQDELNLPWLDAGYPHTSDLNRTEFFLSGEEVRQFPDQLRDWNAEYQSCKELPYSTLQERIFRDRSIIKVTNEFVFSAVAGAKAIANGAIGPINPTEPAEAQLYIYNNIFFSRALNGRYLFDEGEGDMGPYKLVNNDLNGVKAYNLINIPEIHTVLTVLVNYRGHRMVAQSIIPGILHQTSTECIKYGSIDHGKNLVWDKDFHEVMMKAASRLWIPEHEIEDESGTIVKLCCSTETKGVLGTDGRKYVLDLDKTTVRDPNFESSWALLRLELYEHYTEWKRHHHYLKHKAEYLREAANRAAAKTEAEASTEGADSENKEEQAKKALESGVDAQVKAEEADKEGKEEADKETEEKAEEPAMNIPEFNNPTFNPNAHGLKHCKLVGDEESIRTAEEQVKELGQFLTDYIIPTLASEITNNLTYPSDSVTLTALFHSHGVNMRYLGTVANLLKSEKPYARQLMVREMIVRATKHIMNDFIRNSLDVGDYASGISHFLNCFIRGAFMRNYNHPSGRVESHVPELFSLTPTKLWENIEQQVKTQFRFELVKDDFVASAYALPALRTLCQKTGVSIHAKQYDMYAHQPFSEEDIMGLFPVVKMATPVNVDAQDLVEAGKKYLIKGRVDIAFEFLTEALQIFHQTHGPMHPKTAQCYSHLAMVLNHIGDHAQALFHQTKAIIILERTMGLDYYETAFEYANLGLFYHQAQHAPLAFGFLKRSLYLSTLIGGPNHPDNAAALTNIAAIFQDNKEFNNAIEFYKRAIECFEFHFGSKHVNIASSYHNIALCYAHLDNFRAALANEKKSYEIFSEFFGENDPRTVESNNCLKQFTIKAVQIEKDSKTQQQKKLSSNAPEPENRATDDSIGTLPIRDIMKYINNNERSKVRPSFRK